MSEQPIDSSMKLDAESSGQSPLEKLSTKEIDMCSSTELAAMLEASEKQLQAKAAKIKKLKEINERMSNELKVLTETLNESVKKANERKLNESAANTGGKSLVHTGTMDKELMKAQRSVKKYQEEISTLKLKLDAKSGYDR
eukprot:TRINITY_DN4837_c0_g1_i10.p3 TRINITY_DN4837_c0_g1~~TRINITY_DN4837_c0_g1_i10.p3  ORF type:complete len:141 (+),score=47.66 TRINITY_DN4837_c0_g1_i10:107-529(+)